MRYDGRKSIGLSEVVLVWLVLILLLFLVHGKERVPWRLYKNLLKLPETGLHCNLKSIYSNFKGGL